MKKILILIGIFSFAFVMHSNAQNTGSTYKTGLGAKVYFGNGTAGGINIKHFLNQTGALEGSLLFVTGGLGIEGLYEYHGDIAGAQGLKWYAGGGPVIFFATGKYTSGTEFGLRGTLGLDYKISGAPIDVAFGLDPTFFLTPATDFTFAAGLAFRFTF